MSSCATFHFGNRNRCCFTSPIGCRRFVAGAMDARGNGQYLAETAMQRYGARIRQVMLWVEWYRDNMPRYKAAFEDGMIELPRAQRVRLPGAGGYAFPTD